MLYTLHYIVRIMRWAMALTRKNLTLDGDRLRELAERRGISESAAAREAIEEALFTDEFVDLVQQLHDAGFGMLPDEGEPRPAKGDLQ